MFLLNHLLKLKYNVIRVEEKLDLIYCIYGFSLLALCTLLTNEILRILDPEYAMLHNIGTMVKK
jgi:hypothetical protein